MHIQTRSPTPQPAFDAGTLRHEGSLGGRLMSRFLAWPLFMWLLRHFPRIPRWPVCIVARYDDVREVLSQPDVFEVPWANKMKLLQLRTPSPQPFVLGTDDAALHRCGQRRLMQVFRHEDIPRISGIAGRATNHIVGDIDGEVDALKDLLASVSLAIYRDYYGLHPQNRDFILWLMAISTYTFNSAGPNLGAKGPAVAAAECVAEIVGDAFERARRLPDSDTVAARLVRLQEHLQADKPGALPDAALRCLLTGMLLGFGSTLAMTVASILETLLKNRQAMLASRHAAAEGDDEALARCLLEALRLRPIGSGIWRVCAKDHTIAEGTHRATLIRKDKAVLVLLRSAMRDADRVRDGRRFDPSRPPSDSLVFGYGMHRCLGAPLVTGALVQIFKPLLVRGFRRAPCGRGRIRHFGMVPERISLILEPR